MTTKDCIFCKIEKGKLPCEKLYEDDVCLAILDKFPGTKGQSLIISKKHINYIFDLDKKTYNHLFEIARNIGKAIDLALKPERTCILVEGFDVPHVHVRLHPTYSKGLIRNGNEISNKELKEIADKIRRKL